MSLEELNRRIKTTKDIGNIVHTMKMLSSASVGQYDKALQSLNQYVRTIFDAFHGLFSQESFQYTPSPPTSTDAKPLAILIGSDNGLVGKFNTDLIEFAHQSLTLKHPDVQPYIISVGKRISVTEQIPDAELVASYPISNTLKEIAPMAAQLLNQIDQIVSHHKINFVYLFANQRKGNATFCPQMHQLMPLPQTEFKKINKPDWTGHTLPFVSANPHTLFSALVKEYLIVLLSHDLVASLASEHYTRMIHMQEAEQNIEETLKQFNLEYQQLRQTQITDELIDIISGAEEMNKQKTQSPLDSTKKKSKNNKRN